MAFVVDVFSRRIVGWGEQFEFVSRAGAGSV